MEKLEIEIPGVVHRTGSNNSASKCAPEREPFSFGVLVFDRNALFYHARLPRICNWRHLMGSSRHASGMEITVVDLAMLAFFLTLPKPVSKLPFTRTMGFYFLCVLISGFQAALFQPAFCFMHGSCFACSSILLYPGPAPTQGLRQHFSRVWPLACSSRAAWLFMEGLCNMNCNHTEHSLTRITLASFLVFVPLMVLNFAKNVPLLVRSSLLSSTPVAVLTASRATLGLAASGALLVFVYSLICQRENWTRHEICGDCPGCGNSPNSPCNIVDGHACKPVQSLQ